MNTKTALRCGLQQICVVAFLLGLSFCLVRLELPRRQYASGLEPLQQVQRGSSPAFDLSNATIPVNEIQAGGPPKDGIPAISNPRTVAANQAKFLKKDDRVIGLSLQGHSRAYPISIMTQHEIVNDRVSEIPVAVTYCPLCDSAVVFDRRTPLGEREFGVSGLLYNSNVLMYDRAASESLWSQLKCEGVSGPAVGKKLSALPMELTTWAAWQSAHPDTDVLSIETGHKRNYRSNPYAGYFRQSELMFPVHPVSDVLPKKERVLGIWDESSALAVPVSAFGKKSGEVERVINGKKVVIAYDSETQTLRVASADQGLQWMNTFWFAWYAFRPTSEVVRN